MMSTDCVEQVDVEQVERGLGRVDGRDVSPARLENDRHQVSRVGPVLDDQNAFAPKDGAHLFVDGVGGPEPLEGVGGAPLYRATTRRLGAYRE